MGKRTNLLPLRLSRVRAQWQAATLVWQTLELRCVMCMLCDRYAVLNKRANVLLCRDWIVNYEYLVLAVTR